MMAAAACFFWERWAWKCPPTPSWLSGRWRRRLFLPFLALNVGKSSDASLLLLTRKLFFRLNEKQWHSFFFLELSENEMRIKITFLRAFVPLKNSRLFYSENIWDIYAIVFFSCLNFFGFHFNPMFAFMDDFVLNCYSETLFGATSLGTSSNEKGFQSSTNYRWQLKAVPTPLCN